MFAYVHRIISIAIVQHPLGNGGRGVLTVGEYADFLCTLNERAVEIWPRTASQ